ncbi:MAG: discoidin domain-containing protein [Coriobacteriia bacterium]|nr:discoidin domain-containing protein [Coriobacteriia bacterium]
MRRLHLLCAPAVMLAVALVAVPAIAAAAPAAPFETNAECLECHDLGGGSGALTKVDFEVPPFPADPGVPSVDMGKCASCHWVPAGGHPFHNAAANCGACHPHSVEGWGLPDPARVPAVSTAYGWFFSSLSPSAGSEELHAIHLQASWPAAFEGPVTPANGGATRKCASCHAKAACEACHVDPSSQTHADHTSGSVAPWTGVMGSGTPAGDESVLTAGLVAGTCGAAACHSVSTFDSPPSRTEETDSAVSYGGAWSTATGVRYSGGSVRFSGTAGRTAGITVTGGKVTWIGTRGSYGGIAEVLVDGSPVATVDTWASSISDQQALYTVNLGTSGGTVTIRVTGLRNPSATNSYVILDAFDLAPSAAEFRPTCVSCHTDPSLDAVDRSGTHGYETVDHVAGVGGQTHGGKSCDSCHAMDLMTEHERPTSASAGGDCGTCHPMPRNGFGAWERGCQQGGCHADGGPAEPHAGQAAAHIPAAAGAVCAGCHAGDLEEVHADTTSSSGAMSCSICHSASEYPATGDCTECHFTFDGHYDETAHTSSWTLEGCLGSGCHASRDLMTEHSSAREGFACFDCHANTSRPEYAAAIAAGDTACGACHADVTDTGGHYAAHAVVPPLRNADGTGNYTYGVGSTGTVPTSDCAMCHGSNLVDEHMGGNGHLPKKDFTGAFLGCGSCHSSADPAVAAAVGEGLTACEDCHRVHRQIPSVHASSFTGDPDDGCSLCHSSDLTYEHDFDMTTTLPSGRVLSGCELCHDYYEGERAAVIQTAIEITGDTRCTACHADRHADIAVKHTATTPASAEECGRCHDDGSGADGTDVTVVHADAALGGCRVCHANPSRVPDVTTSTAECASCHSSSGTDHHRSMAASHTYGAMDASCRSAGCHVANTLPEEHERFLGRYPEYADGCELCHLNAVAERIDWSRATADCASCHTIHGDIETLHTAPESQECVDCHETADVRVLHALVETDPSSSCAVCHRETVDTSGTTACAGCHDYSPPDPKHYDEVPHLADNGTLSPGGGSCSSCHYLDMRTEHFKDGSLTAEGQAITCVLCHEVKVDAFSSAWDGSCEACHAGKHGGQSAGHDFSATNAGCGGPGCHSISNVVQIHNADPGRPCGSCHGPSSIPPKDCTASGCHPGATGDHHEDHDTTGYVDGGCKGCHFVHLDDEHIALGYTCDVCHKSADPDVRDAIAAGRRDCDACHPAVNGRHRHADLWPQEFTEDNASGHRADASLPGMRTSFVVGGKTYTWALPASGRTFKAGWTYDSMVACDGCHTFAGSAEGPHGASVTVNVDPAYPRPYAKTKLSDESGPAPGFHADSICAKCHVLYSGGWGSYVHAKHARGYSNTSRQGEGCVTCHAGIPHGWRLPRLLAYRTDPAPYGTSPSYGFTQLKLRSYSNVASESGWDKSDCGGAGSGCGKHNEARVSPVWPSTQQAFGDIAGTVTTAGGAPITGATVATGGQSAVTDSGGRYTIARVPVGDAAVTASAEGYGSQTKTVSVVKDVTAAADFTLSPASSNAALGKTASASSRYSSSYSADKAVDGSTSTYWRSSSGGIQWLSVDLGAAYSLEKAVIVWNGGYYAKGYRVEVSADGSDWTQVYSTSSGTSGTRTSSFTATARYVRLYCTSANSSSYRVNEFEVWGR